MSALFEAPKRLWNAFIDAAAQGVSAASDRLFPPRRLSLIEQDDGRFAATRGDGKAITTSLALGPGGALIGDGRSVAAAARGAIVDLVLRVSRGELKQAADILG